jgi:hypothetical protein
MLLIFFLLTACSVCYLPVEKAIKLMPVIPSDTPIIKNLTYVTERVSTMPTHGNGGSDFGGRLFQHTRVYACALRVSFCLFHLASKECKISACFLWVHSIRSCRFEVPRKLEGTEWLVVMKD